MKTGTSSPAAASPEPLMDGCGRRIDHLRLSLTDCCNLACRYCSVTEHMGSRFMDAGFAVALVRWMSGRYGIRYLRLTGGEPLLHPRLLEMVTALSALNTLEEITLTTNGQTLGGQAHRLRQAGLTRVNISLDTLVTERFAQITHGGTIANTLQGIDASLAAQLSPVRLNVLVQRGFNDDEVPRLAEWGLTYGCTVRFLEVMPIGPMVDRLPSAFFPASAILARLGNVFSLQPIQAPPGQPATDYAAVSRNPSGPSGTIGVIASTSRPFCARCRRLRITSAGEILSCLFVSEGSNLSTAWDGHFLNEEVADEILQNAVRSKPAMGRQTRYTPMIAIGG